MSVSFSLKRDRQRALSPTKHPQKSPTPEKRPPSIPPDPPDDPTSPEPQLEEPSETETDAYANNSHILEKTPSGVYLADVTAMRSDSPEPAPNTTLAIVEQHLEKRFERRTGDRRRARIGETPFTAHPDMQYPPSAFIDLVGPETAINQYTQVLIWCLENRLRKLRTRQADSLPTAAEEYTRGALNALVHKLAYEPEMLDWSKRGPLSPRPLAPNPINEVNARILKHYEKERRLLLDEKNRWLALLREFEEMQEAQIERTQVEKDPLLLEVESALDETEKSLKQALEKAEDLVNGVTDAVAGLEIKAERVVSMAADAPLALAPKLNPMNVLNLLVQR